MRQVTEAAVAAGKSKMPSLRHNDTYMIGPGREVPYTRVFFVKTTWAVLPKIPTLKTPTLDMNQILVTGSGRPVKSCLCFNIISC